MPQMFWLVTAVLGTGAAVGGLVLGDDGGMARLCTVCGVAVAVMSMFGYFASLGLQGVS